jgi:hypothetical protein
MGNVTLKCRGGCNRANVSSCPIIETFSMSPYPRKSILKNSVTRSIQANEINQVFRILVGLLPYECNKFVFRNIFKHVKN